MKEINNYKYLFLKKIYNELNLNLIEKELDKQNIKPLDIVPDENYHIISHYFFLLNDINIQKLNNDQLQKFYYYFSKNINELSETELKEIYKFIDETYPLMLFKETNNNFVSYGGIDSANFCPKDAIALGLYYNAFGDYDDFELENKLANIINYIQFELAKNINKKVAVQLTLDNLFDNFDNIKEQK